MTQLPRFKTRFGEGIGVELLIQTPDLVGNEKTFLSADEASGQTDLSVESGVNFSANDYVLICRFGEETAEIVLISSASTSTINGKHTSQRGVLYPIGIITS